jgi:signal transduction histidine kinase
MRDRARVRSAAVALVVFVAVVVHVATDNAVLANVCYLGTLIGASFGAWAGAEHAPRGQRVVPRLIALGISLTALGETLWMILKALGTEADVSIADGPWFLSYAALGAALGVVLKQVQASSHFDANFLIDAATIVVVSVLIFWSLVIESIVADQSVPLVVRAVWAAYPVADAVLLALIIRVFLSSAGRHTMDALFAVGVCLWLAADIAYLEVPHTDGPVLDLIDVCWMVAPVLIARSAWRVRDFQPDPSAEASDRGRSVQLLIAVIPLFVPPALEVVADWRGELHHPLQLFIGMTVLIALAFLRTSRLLQAQARHERELVSARDAALEASKAKSMFLANVSHELRTPLTTVLATGEMLEDTTLDVLQRGLLTKLNRQGELLRNLVEEVLDFSRIEAGELRLSSSQFDPHALVGDIADVYINRALEKGIGFDWQVDPQVPTEVVGDTGRIFQILTNLLDNAFKFTDQGSIALLVRPAPAHTHATEHEVEFLVNDTGIGIPEADQDAIFDAFTQVDGSTTRRHGGAGLGLAICKQLAELMGGTIRLRSELDIGSTFIVRLPLPRPVDHRSGDHDTVSQAQARVR